MSRHRRFALIALAFAATPAASASDLTSAGPRLTLGAAELGPFAYTHFCVRYPAECRLRGGDAGVELTLARRRELVGVNAAVNRSITPASHAGRGTFDTWTIAPARGDCNDFAVTKRHDLLSRNWPSAALLLAEVVTAWGDHHLVLVVRTTAADLVLDNLDPEVRTWTVPDYMWLRAQMPAEPALWAKVAAPVPQRVARASVRPTGERASTTE